MAGSYDTVAINGTGRKSDRRKLVQRPVSRVDTKIPPSKDGQVPFSRAGLLSRASYWWMWHIMLDVHKRGLRSLLTMSWWPEDGANTQVQSLERCWLKELQDKGPSGASLQRALISAFWGSLIKTIVIIIITLSFSFLGSAFVLRVLLDHISSSHPDTTIGVIIVFSLIACEFCRSFTFSLAWSCNYYNGMRGRSGAMGLLYKKILRLRSLKDRNIGELVNLFSHDGQRVFEAMANGPFIIGGILIFVAGSVYLCYLMGVWGLVAIFTYTAVFVIIAILNGGIEYFRKKAVRLTSKRVGLMTEVLTCIKLIKMNSWQTAFINRIRQCRQEEHGALQKASFLKSLVTSVVPMIPVIASVFLFLGYVLSGNDLTASQAFTVISVFYAMSFSLASALYGVQTLVDAGVAVRRYKEILLMEEQTVHDKTLDESLAIEIKMASLTWEDEDEMETETREEDSIIGGLNVEDVQSLPTSPLPLPGRRSVRFESLINPDTKETAAVLLSKAESAGAYANGREEDLDTPSLLALQDVDISIKKGELVGVCGMKGSGKSSLLSALLGKMHLVEGNINVSGSIAYLSQEPWIMNGTARENILFGKPYDEARYQRVVKATKLEKDFETFSARDEVEIGDRGLTLSGGQKQRISLARAIYSDLDIFLLDDPLSAVDVNMGRHIFSQCVKTILHNKTIIMVTHHLEYLPKCHRVLYLHNGCVVAYGPHAQLMDSNSQYAELSTLYNSKYDRILKERMKAKDKRESQTIPQRGFAKVNKKELNRQISRMSIGPGLQNQISVLSNSSLADYENANVEDLAYSRDQPDWLVRSSTYHTYIRAMGGVIVFLFLLFSFMLSIVIQSMTTGFLAYWLNKGAGWTNSSLVPNVTTGSQGVTSSAPTNATSPLPSSSSSTSSSNRGEVLYGSVLDNPDLHTYALVYAMFLIAMLILMVGRSALFVKILLRAGNNLHKQLLQSTLASPMRFFDATPIGMILNRFSADMDELDVRLLGNCELFLQNVFLVLSALALISVIFPWELMAILPAIAVFMVLVHVFAPILQQMKFMDNITRAPYLSHLTASVEGISTINCFGQGQEFYKRFCDLLNKNNVPFFLFYAANRWLAVFLDSMTIVVTGATGFLIIFTVTPDHSSQAGLALSFAIQITSLVQYTLRLSLETISRFSSVQRIQDYVETLETEGSSLDTDHYTPLSWPSEGKIVFKQYSMRYNDGLPNALKNINLTISASEKIGVVGNSGSGKSSLGVGVFRLAEGVAGAILIDDVNIRDIPLHVLRSRLSIVVQDPVLFTGTIRYNLDPSQSIDSDDTFWNALEKCHMKSQIKSMDKGLDAMVEENGRNFSMGERQLLCLARTLLRNTKVLVLDEATASLDAATEVLVQQTIKDVFKHCTVLMIAHRINTIWDCDKVLVMEAGKTVEYNHPSVLLQKSQSRFKFMFDLMKSQPRGSSINEDACPAAPVTPRLLHMNTPASPRFSTSPHHPSPLAVTPSPSPRADCSPLRDSVIFDEENEPVTLRHKI